MKLPFILQQHEKDHAQLKELREGEIDFVSGARAPEKMNTITVTPDGDGGDDGMDAN